MLQSLNMGRHNSESCQVLDFSIGGMRPTGLLIKNVNFYLFLTLLLSSSSSSSPPPPPSLLFLFMLLFFFSLISRFHMIFLQANDPRNTQLFRISLNSHFATNNLNSFLPCYSIFFHCSTHNVITFRMALFVFGKSQANGNW